MNTLYIYTSPSDKQYIGVTTRLRRRMYEHKRANTPFGKALRKYKEENFKVRTFTFDSIDEAYSLEELLVRDKQALGDWSYNQCVGGRCGNGHAATNPMNKESNRRKRSELMKTSWNPMSNPEARKAHKEAMSTEEYRDFHRALTAKRMQDPEAKAKAVEGSRKANAQRAKRVQCDNVCFTSVADAADYLGIQRATLRDRIKSKTSKFTDFRYII